MKRNGWLFCVLVLAAGSLLLGCDKNPLKAREYPNRGSRLYSVQAGITAIRKYAEQEGHLPRNDVDLTTLGDYGVPSEVAVMLQYGGSESLNLKSSERIIVLKCILPASTKNRAVKYYCALLSGEILLLAEKDAALGKLCPIGTGEIMIAKP
jgi:hypothetical protein